VGYLAQAQAGLNPEQSVLDAILDVQNLPLARARNFLGQFLFSGDDVFRKIGTLSGGQRSRVALARLTLQGANFLLLDEPTNHLDITSQEILEDVLRQFPGTVLLVSHDRYLVQSIATHIWRVDGEALRAYKGNYEDYLRQREAEAAAPAQVAERDAETGVDSEDERARSREERRQRKAAQKQAELAAAMEAEIVRVEAHLAQLSAQLEAASVRGDVARVQELGLQYQHMDAELHRLMASWTELA
jgi:ATP-binding cassette subfamily F protein 3